MFLVVLAIAAVVLYVLPGTASAFNIANFNYTNSTLQSAGHPNVTISFDRQGSESEDLKDIQLDLPTGVFANPESVTSKCTASQFNSDTCPAGAQVGSMSATVKALSLLDLNIPGSIDVLSPDSNHVATLGLTLRPAKICILFVFCAQPQKIYLKTGITVRTYEDSGLRTYTPGSPRSAVIGIPLLFITPTITGDITVNKMSLSFQSRSGSGTPTGKYFWTQTGSCMPAVSNVKIVSYASATSSSSKTFTPTGCPSVPFNPSIAADPANKNSNQAGALKFTLNVPEADATVQNALPKIVDIDFPLGSGLDLQALSGVDNCTEDELKARACPASSIIGTANAFSKYLPGSPSTSPGLVGNVYAMGVGNQVPVGVEVVGPRNTIIIFRGTLGTRGDANTGNGRVYATFDKIPQLPYSSFSLTITKQLYKNPSTCGSQTTTAVVTGFNGTAATSGSGTQVTRTSAYNVVNCQTAPETTITGGPGTTTADTTPPFSFTSNNASATFECRVDSTQEAAFAPCTSPFTTEPLADGSHKFDVRAVVGTVKDGSPASYSFTVDTTGIEITPTITPSTTQAVAHPNLTASFDITGGQPQKIALRLPKGFNASLAARSPLCTNAQATAGTCPATSKIGTASLTVDKFGGPETGTGDVFLTEGPQGDDAGGVVAKIQFSFGTLITQGGAYLVENGTYQYLDLRNIPLDVNGTSINATNLTVNLDGVTGSFLTNPSNCLTSAWVSSGRDWAGNDASVFNVPFTATGCNTITANPSISQTLSSPVAGTETGVVANLGFPAGNSAYHRMRVNEPPTLSPNFPSFGTSADQCPASAAPSPTSIFNPASCPAQATVGTMTVNTPLLPFPLTGKVHLIEKSPIPWLGVDLDSAGIHIRLTGVTSTPQVDPSCNPLTSPLGFCQSQISIMFNNLPDVQMSSINMNLDGPNRAGTNGPLSGKILKVAGEDDPTCVDTTPASSDFYPYSSLPDDTVKVNRTQDITIEGCIF